jgi:hypothetical protein
MRGSNHSHEFRLYEVTAKGVVVGESLTQYDGILGGTPILRAKVNGAAPEQKQVKAEPNLRTRVAKVTKTRRGK